MRPFGALVSFEDALAIVEQATVPIDRTEVVPLAHADGRVAAADIVSAVDVPPFDRAAMDGYAVIASDTAAANGATTVALRCVGEIYSGAAADFALHPGECAVIATGAPLPAGADAVVMVEATTRDGDWVRVGAPARPSQNVGRRATDISRGHVVMRRGRTLSPSGVGALAAVGVADVAVFARPSVAIISTGNEVVVPGEPLRAGHIYDINRYTLAALVERHGGDPIVFSAASDTLESLTAVLDDALAHDIIVFSGGSSVGDRDLLVDVIRARGEVLFHGIAVKPGKPTLFARVERSLVLGMPGNPASCLSNAYLLLVPLLRATARLHPRSLETRQLPLSRAIQSVAGRRQFLTVRVVDGRAEPAFKTSGDVTSMANADGFIEIGADTLSLDEGTLVTVTLF